MDGLFKVGIIGGIGSGKSAVTGFLRALGANVLVADELNAELLTNPNYIAELRTVFPQAVSGNAVDKSMLASIIFNDELSRQKLMALSHPRILAIMNERAKSGLNFFEIPLFNETDIKFDRLWYIYAENERRIARVTERSGISRETAERIIVSQGEINETANNLTIIDNNEGLSRLKIKVEELYCALFAELQQR